MIPRLSQSETLDQPDATPYVEGVDGAEDLDRALARAKAAGKKVLLNMGGNWCGDCRAVAGILDIPEVKAYIAGHYELAWVNVGRYTENLHVAERFGVALHAAPTFVVLDADGGILNPDDMVTLRAARSMTPQAILDWLAQWAE
jgi:thiol-disulfide isomerase/thioredoxin